MAAQGHLVLLLRVLQIAVQHLDDGILAIDLSLVVLCAHNTGLYIQRLWTTGVEHSSGDIFVLCLVLCDICVLCLVLFARNTGLYIQRLCATSVGYPLQLVIDI